MKNLGLNLFMLFIIALASVLLFKANSILREDSMGLDCHIENATVLRSYVKETTLSNPVYKECPICLHLDVINSLNKTKTLFFADDTSSEGFKQNDSLQILWCMHPKISDYIIFGINKIE